MTRDKTTAGYLIRNLGTSVQVCRPGETDPAFIVSTVPEALAAADSDKAAADGPLLRCPGCKADACDCLPA